MWYDYRCTRRHVFEREFVHVPQHSTQMPMRWRDSVICVCGAPAERLSGFPTMTITVPSNLHTSMSDIIGAPGSYDRQLFEQNVRAGKVEYAGPGSRWV